MPIDMAPPMTGNLQGFQVAPVQSTDPLQTLSQMSQLRTQGLQQQQAQLGIQQAQLQMKSQQAMLKAFVDGGGDPDKTQQIVMTHPDILPADKVGLQTHMLDLAKQKLALTGEQQSLQDRENDYWAGLLSNAKNQDDVNAAVATGLQRGYKPPSGMVDAQGNIQQFTDPQHITAYANGLLSLSKMDAQKLVQQQTASSAAEAGAATERGKEAAAAAAETTLKTKQLQGQLDWLDKLTPQGLADYVGGSIDKNKYPDLFARAFNDASNARAMKNPAAVQAAIDKYAGIASEGEKTVATETDPRVLKAREDVARANTQGRVTIEMARDAQMLQGGGANAPGGAGSDGLSGDAYLGTLNPAFAARLKAIARGDEAAPTGRAATSGPGALLMNALYRYDPDFTPLLAQKRKTELADFTKTGSGDAGGKIVALDTMIHHADLYLETADALKNGTFVPGNRVYNAVATAFGKAPPTEAGLVAQFFAGETAKVAGEQSQGEVNAILDKMKTDGSPEQMKQAGQRLLQIAAGRMIPYQERIADAKLQNLAPPILGPSEKEILQRRGFDPNTMQPVKQGGPAQYSKYGKDPKTGHRIGLGTDNKWHDVVSGAVIQ